MFEVMSESVERTSELKAKKCRFLMNKMKTMTVVYEQKQQEEKVQKRKFLIFLSP